MAPHMMKILILLISVFVVSPFFLLPGEGKIVYIPDKINVEENTVETATIVNMSEINIYRTCPLYVIDDFIYIVDISNTRVFKLSYQGKVISQFGRKGQGPGESSRFYSISRFKENIAVIGKNKVIICNKDLKYLREIKLKEMFFDLILAANNKIYFYDNPSYFNYYFTVYTEDFKYLKRFGIKDPNAKKKKIDFRHYTHSWDIIRKTLYVPEENGIWVSFGNRYDIRCYKDEKVVVDIKSKKQMFAANEDEFMGIKTKMYTDRSILMAKHGNQLYYCYTQGDNLFCDVFNLSENYRLHRRLKLPFLYRQLAHVNGSIFYGLRYDEDKENVFMDKIKIN
jgi:hypothetical protein